MSSGGVSDTPAEPVITVKLFTSWLPVFWPDVEDFGHLMPADQRTALDAHQSHRVSALNSAIGWRAMHCADCAERIWTHPDHVESS